MIGQIPSLIYEFVMNYSSWIIIGGLIGVTIWYLTLRRKQLSQGEFQKFGLLSLIFSAIIGTYWLLRPLKDSIFMSVVGSDYIPYAKFLSLGIVFPLVIIYSKLVDIFPRQKLFYVLCTIYGVVCLIFAFLAYNPSIGLSIVDPSPGRLWGWAWYVYVESFGSLIVALFWAFAADTTTPDSASRGYPMVAFGGQIGNIIGPLLLGILISFFSTVEVGPQGSVPGVPGQNAGIMAAMMVLAACLIFSIIGLIKLFVTSVPEDQLVGYQAEEEEVEESTGFFEGLRLLFSSGYLLAIFAIIASYEIIVTVLDFNFKTLIGMNFPDPASQAIYLASYGTLVGIVSMLSIFFGINKIQKMLGLGASLALLPLLIALAVGTFFLYPMLSVVFWIMVFSKAINYALTQPSMKQLYIPISKQAKYKSQAFIETYGSRGSKAGGSLVNASRKIFLARFGEIAGLAMFIKICTGVSMAIIVVWFFITLFLGRKYKKAVDHNEVII